MAQRCINCVEGGDLMLQIDADNLGAWPCALLYCMGYCCGVVCHGLEEAG